MVDRISTFTQTSSLIENNMKTQAKYAEGQLQLSSGMKSDTYQGISEDTPQILSLESEYERIVSQTENSETATSRLENMYTALSSMIDTGQSFYADLNGAVSGTSLEGDALVELAEQQMDAITSLMNTQVGGRYLFSGSATNTAPVDMDAYVNDTVVNPTPPPATTTVWNVENTSYYQGNDYSQSVEASDGTVIEYGVTADNSAFEKILRAFDQVINNADDTDALAEAYDLFAEGLDELSELQSSVSQSATTLDQIIDDNLTELDLIEAQISDLKEVDLAEVSTRLASLETQLEASYSVTTTLLQLNLVDYL